MNLFSKLDISIDKFDNSIQTYLKKALGSMNIEYNGTELYSVIFKGIKGIVQNLMFYIEDALNEQNVLKATRRKSIYSLAKIAGYEPYYGSPAIGTILCSVKINNGLNNASSKVIIEDETRIKNTINNIVYTIKLNTARFVFDIYQPIISHEFNITQGFYSYSNYVAQGNVLETISVNSVELFDVNSITVTVNGKEWHRVGNIYDMSEESEDYVLTIGYDNAFDVMFGNGVYGKKLEPGDSVSIKFIKHVGSYGNITMNDLNRFKFVDSGYDIYGNVIDLNNYLRLTINHIITGGIDADKIEYIRNVIGSNSRSNVIVSTDNFNLFLNKFSFIGFKKIFIEANTLNITCIAFRNFANKIVNPEDYLKLEPGVDMFLSDNEQKMVINTLFNSNKIFAGLNFKFISPVIRKFAFICYVKIDDVYNNHYVESAIIKELCEYFMNLDDHQFIPKSSIIKMLTTNISEIKSISIEIISELNENSYVTGKYKKYKTNKLNNTISIETEDVVYNTSMTPGLDVFGNISLDSQIEFPMIHGGFKYYPNKNNILNNDNIAINIDEEMPIKIYFIQ